MYKGLVQIVFMVTDHDVGTIGEDRKHWWMVLWKMRKLKDRCRRDEGDPRGQVTTAIRILVRSPDRSCLAGKPRRDVMGVRSQGGGTGW